MEEIRKEEVVGMAKNITVKLGENFFKVSVWMQKAFSPKDPPEKVFEEVERIIDKKLEEALSKFQIEGFELPSEEKVQKVKEKNNNKQKIEKIEEIDIDVW